jgi:hypothetical protein
MYSNPRKLRWQGPAAYTKDRPALSSERAPHKKRPLLSNSNKYLVMSPRRGSTPRLTNRLTDCQSQYDFDFWVVRQFCLYGRLWRKELVSVEWRFCTGVYENRNWARDAEVSPLLEAIVRERLVKTQQAGRGLTGAVLICKLLRLAVAL